MAYFNVVSLQFPVGFKTWSQSQNLKAELPKKTGYQQILQVEAWFFTGSISSGSEHWNNILISGRLLC